MVSPGCPACCLYPSAALPAGDTPELLFPSRGFSETGGSVRRTMAFPSAPTALWSVSLLTVLLSAAVHSNPVYGKHLSPSLSARSLFRSVSLSLLGPLTSLTLFCCLWWCPLSVDLGLFPQFLYYDKGIREPLISTWDTPTSQDPQWNFYCCYLQNESDLHVHMRRIKHTQSP